MIANRFFLNFTFDHGDIKKIDTSYKIIKDKVTISENRSHEFHIVNGILLSDGEHSE